MKIFIDTSSLFKLYHKENGTDILEQFFRNNTVTTVFLTEIAKIEFASTVWKKVRTQEINEGESLTILKRFETDFDKYTFIQIDSIITEQARTLITKYGMQGLRTLDSIQLSTAVVLKNECGIFISSDRLLNTFFENESLPIEIIHNQNRK